MSALGRRLFALAVTSMSLVACSAIWGFDDLRRAGPNEDGGPGADADAGPPPNPDAVGNKTANKVDFLFVIDSSASMGPKQAALSRGLSELVSAVAASNDVHAGVLSGSFGSPGGDICVGGARLDDRGRLLAAYPGALSSVVDLKDYASVDLFFDGFAGLVARAGTEGCGLQAPLESLYHFLSAPDPWDAVKVVRDKASYSGVDDKVLAQRAAFLRPDSLLVIVMVTDRGDASLDPLSFSGLGWAFSAFGFPGSPVPRGGGVGFGTTAPRATSVCQANPADPGCTSCKCVDPPCPDVSNDPSCKENGGYYGSKEEWLLPRFHKMKQRFGRDPQFPVDRYVKALTKVRVPRTSDEHRETHTAESRIVADYDSNAATCTNPLFAAKLPKSSSEEWCNLPIGPRDKNLVLFAVIGGVPPSLIERTVRRSRGQACSAATLPGTAMTGGTRT